MTSSERLPDSVSDTPESSDQASSTPRYKPFLRERGLSREERARNVRTAKILALVLVAVFTLIVAKVLWHARVNSTDFLIGRLSNPNPGVRQDAALRLPNRPQDAERIVAALGPCLKDSDASVRQAALFSLDWYPKSSQALALEFVRLLDDPDGRVRLQACFNLCNLPEGPEKLAALKAVITLGYRKTPPFTPESELSLDTIGWRNKEAYPDLVKLLRDSNAQYNARCCAARALQYMSFIEPELIPEVNTLADELAATEPELGKRVHPFSEKEAERMRHFLKWTDDYTLIKKSLRKPGGEQE